MKEYVFNTVGPNITAQVVSTMEAREKASM